MGGALTTRGWLLAGVVLLSASGQSLDAQGCVLEIPAWAPRGSTETVRPKIFATIASTCGTAIDVASIRMTVDEEPVAPTPDGTGAKVTVVYVPESALLEEADHTVTVQALDANGVAGERTWTFYLPDSYLR